MEFLNGPWTLARHASTPVSGAYFSPRGKGRPWGAGCTAGRIACWRIADHLLRPRRVRVYTRLMFRAL